VLVAAVATVGGLAVSASAATKAVPATALAPAFTASDLYTFPNVNWPTNGGNIQNSRYSTLNQINTANVGQLKPAWTAHLDKSGTGKKYSAEGTPVVYNGVMYIPTGNNDVFALDATTGARLWTYKSGVNQKITTICCGWDSRGVAIGEGKVFSAQLDGRLVALDQTTGVPVWAVQNVRWQEGYTMTMAPLYYNGMVIVGMSGGEFGARGSVTAYSAKNGARLWRFFTVPAPGEIGGATWSGEEWTYGGATVWNTPSVDPNLNLIYFSTSNADPWAGRGPGDNLFTASIVAIHADTGQYAWHYQTVHHDLWDYDQPSPTVTFDVMYKGQLRHAVAEPAKTGWVYILDRATGDPLIGIKEKKVPQLKSQNTSATQPIPVGDAFVEQCSDPKIWPKKAPNGKPFKQACIFEPFGKDQFVVAAPGAGGGNNWPPSSYNPNTHALYVCAQQSEFAYTVVPKALAHVGGQNFVGVNFAFPNRKVTPGTVTAMDMSTNKIIWQNKWSDSPCYSGTFTTAGGFVFVGKNDGSEIAYDAATGKELFRWKGDAGANAPGITYSVNGKQYVAFYLGGTSLGGASKHGDTVAALALP
jgi:quinohemoprotein ethanol dehydrogenase